MLLLFSLSHTHLCVYVRIYLLLWFYGSTNMLTKALTGPPLPHRVFVYSGLWSNDGSPSGAPHPSPGCHFSVFRCTPSSFHFRSPFASSHSVILSLSLVALPRPCVCVCLFVSVCVFAPTCSVLLSGCLAQLESLENLVTDFDEIRIQHDHYRLKVEDLAQKVCVPPVRAWSGYICHVRVRTHINTHQASSDAPHVRFL